MLDHKLSGKQAVVGINDVLLGFGAHGRQKGVV